MLSSSIVALFALTAGLPAILAQNPYNQDPEFFSCSTTDYHNGATSQPVPSSPLTSAYDCAATCYSVYGTGAPYSSFIASTQSCRCNTANPLVPNYTAGNPGQCGVGLPEVMITHTSFALNRCAFGYQGFTALRSGSETDVMRIFTQCAQYRFINIYTEQQTQTNGVDNPPKLLFNCGNTVPVITNTQTCAVSTDHMYEHTPEAQASLLSRRRRREQLAIEAVALKSDCPAGLVPCQVSSTPGVGFECIDTKTELESCGGCQFGIYSHMGHVYNNTAGATGTNCGTIPHTIQGSQACTAGQCDFKCRKGYKRDGLSCVPVATGRKVRK